MKLVLDDGRVIVGSPAVLLDTLRKALLTQPECQNLSLECQNVAQERKKVAQRKKEVLDQDQLQEKQLPNLDQRAGAQAGTHARVANDVPHATCSFCQFVRGVKLWADVRDPAAVHEVWALAFPAVDMVKEARAALAWEISNPARRKVNHKRFLCNWFSRVQDRGGSGPATGAGGRRATDWHEGTPEWQRAQEEARRRAMAAAEETRRALAEKLQVVESAEKRKEVLQRVGELAAKFGVKS